MKYFKSIVATLAFSTMFASCDMSDFGDINYSPNNVSTAYSNMLFLGASLYARNFVLNSSTFDPWTQEWNGYISEAKILQYGDLSTTPNYATRDVYLRAIGSLNEVIEMNEDEALKSTVAVTSFGSNANQIAASRTLRAFFYMTLSDIIGPLPYTDAFKGVSEDIWQPKYDSGESIYAALDQDLQEAYNQFDTSNSLIGGYDIFYNGDMSKWKKFNASLRMMMAIKMADADPTNGKARFAKAYNDGGMTEVGTDLIGGNFGDDFAYTFDNSGLADASFYTIGNKSNASRTNGFGPNQVIVEALKEYKDPRLFTYFTLDGYLGKRTGDATDYNAYLGIPFGLGTNDAVASAASKACSVADKYCEKTATYGLITTARTLLVEAEAAELGWIEADPKALYEAGIRASFKENGAEGVEEYIASAKVALSSDKDEAIKQIVWQRYFAGFMTDGVEQWADWRRFNIPRLPILEAPLKVGIDQYPYRIPYSDNSWKYNEANVQVAVDTWLGGKDSKWSRLWWDTADNESYIPE